MRIVNPHQQGFIRIANPQQQTMAAADLQSAAY
jgi:hypothetical protein